MGKVNQNEAGTTNYLLKETKMFKTLGIQYKTHEYFFTYFIHTILQAYDRGIPPEERGYVFQIPFKKPVEILAVKANNEDAYLGKGLVPAALKIIGLIIKGGEFGPSALCLKVIPEENQDSHVNEIKLGAWSGESGRIEILWLDFAYLFGSQALLKINSALEESVPKECVKYQAEL
jgi:hypothetical protein